MLRSVGKQSGEFVESALTNEEEKEGCRGKDLEKRMHLIFVDFLSFYQTALGNCYGLKLPKCSLQFKKKFVVLFIIIFGTISFPVSAT